MDLEFQDIRAEVKGTMVSHILNTFKQSNINTF